MTQNSKGTTLANTLSLAFFTGNLWDQYLICPGDRHYRHEEIDFWLHIENVLIDRGGDCVTVAQDGVGFLNRPSPARGAIIQISMACEWGHKFVLHLQFHKGVTHFAVTDFRSTPTDRNPDYSDLWRD